MNLYQMIAAAIAANSKNLAAARREGYIYLVVEALIFRVQIGNVAIVTARPVLCIWIRKKN